MASLSFKVAAAAVLVAVAFVAQLQAARFVAEEREFDYFVLSLQWPGNSCRNNKGCDCPENGCCTGADTPTQFTIHGLWPVYEWGHNPQCCTDAVFNETEIIPLKEQLNKSWPTYRCGSQPTCNGRTGSLWAEEYEKHGTCASHVMKSEFEYFDQALNLFLESNVNKALKHANIVASDTATYPKDEVIRVLEDVVLQGGKPQLICADDDEEIVKELWLCYDIRLLPRDCDPIPESCSKSIKFPPIPPPVPSCGANGAISRM